MNYQLVENINLAEYETNMSNFSSQETYNDTLKVRGGVRGKCKDETRRIVEELSSQLNVGESKIYHLVSAAKEARNTKMLLEVGIDICFENCYSFMHRTKIVRGFY